MFVCDRIDEIINETIDNHTNNYDQKLVPCLNESCEKRSVFVYRIGNSSEKELFDYFVHFGPIRDLFLIRDDRTGESKGVCFMEFCSSETKRRVLEEETLVFTVRSVCWTNRRVLVANGSFLELEIIKIVQLTKQVVL